MHREQHAMMWALIASGVAGSSLRARNPDQIADETDKIIAEYKSRYPEPERDREEIPDPQPERRG